MGWIKKESENLTFHEYGQILQLTEHEEKGCDSHFLKCLKIRRVPSKYARETIAEFIGVPNSQLLPPCEEDLNSHLCEITLRPEKHYSVSELSKVLVLAPYDLFILINKSGILFDLIDNQAVYKGSEIQAIINPTKRIS